MKRSLFSNSTAFPMTTPMATPMGHRVISENLDMLIEELLLDSDDEEDEEELLLPEEFHEFLVSDPEGPRLDEDVVLVMAKNGVSDGKSFLTYAKQPLSDMVSGLNSKELKELSKTGLIGVKLFGDYVQAHGMVDSNGEPDFTSIDRKAYTIYWKSHRRRIKSALEETVEQEISTRVESRARRRDRLSSLKDTLEGVMRPSLHLSPDDGHRGRSFGTPDTVVQDGAAGTSHRHVTPDGDLKSRSNVDGCPLTGGNTMRNEHDKEHPSSSGGRKLHYLDDDDGLFYMVTPTKDDLDAPIDRDDAILSPGLGNPAVDPEHINRIQNPVSYGPTQKT